MLNLPNLMKNPFAKSTPAPSPPGSSMPGVNDPHKAVKRWQLEYGRTRKRVEDITGQLDAARLTLTENEHTLGERMADGLDSTTATDAMKHAADQVRALEVALTVAMEKDATAQGELKAAERQVAIDAEAAACQRVLALSPRGEALLSEVKQFTLDIARETESLRLNGGNERYSYPSKEICQQWELLVRLSIHPMTTSSRDSFMKFKTWTACLQAICGKPQP